MPIDLFTKEEALISCSSLSNLDLFSFPNATSFAQSSLSVGEDFIFKIAQIISTDIEKAAMKIANKNIPISRETLAVAIVNILLNRRYRRSSRESNNPDMMLKKMPGSYRQKATHRTNYFPLSV